MGETNSQTKSHSDIKHAIRRWLLGALLLAIGSTLALLFISFYAQAKQTERQPDFYVYDDVDDHLSFYTHNSNHRV